MRSNHITKLNRYFVLLARSIVLGFAIFLIQAPKVLPNKKPTKSDLVKSDELAAPTGPTKDFDSLSSEVKDLLTLARTAQRQNRYDEAFNLYMKARQKDPLAPGIDYPLAIMALHRGDFIKAKTYLLAAINQKDNLVSSYNLLGIIYGQEGSDSMALEQFNNAIHENSSDSLSYFNASEAYRRMGQVNEAIEMLRAAIQLSPSNALYALKMRLTRIEAGQQDLMLQAAKQELKAHPSAGDWLLTAAAVQLRKGKISDAVNYLNQAQSNVDPSMFNAVLEDLAFSRYSGLKELSVFYPRTRKSS